MPDEFAALDRIAHSYETLAQTQQTLAQATTRLEGTQRLLARLQACALVLLGFCLCFTGYVVWQQRRGAQDHTALVQALTVQTQALTAQTQALTETLKRLPTPQAP